MKRARWITLILAIGSMLTWAGVSSLRLIADGQRLGPKSIANPTIYVSAETGQTIDPEAKFPLARLDLYGLRQDDVLLRILSALFLSVHLILLNLDRGRLVSREE